MSNKFSRFPFKEGMGLELRKQHPCGGRTWTILRIGVMLDLNVILVGIR